MVAYTLLVFKYCCQNCSDCWCSKLSMDDMVCSSRPWSWQFFFDAPTIVPTASLFGSLASLLPTTCSFAAISRSNWTPLLCRFLSMPHMLFVKDLHASSPSYAPFCRSPLLLMCCYCEFGMPIVWLACHNHLCACSHSIFLGLHTNLSLWDLWFGPFCVKSIFFRCLISFHPL